MSGKYRCEETLLLRLMMRAIEQSDLTHEINNACASISANLTYIALQSRSQISEQSNSARAKETLEEFAEICDESAEAVQRVTKALGQPNTTNGDEIIEVELEETISRLIACLKNYVPIHEIHLNTVKKTARIGYKAFVYSLTKVLLSTIDDRITSRNPEKKRTDIELKSSHENETILLITTHLPSDQATNTSSCVEELLPFLEDVNFQLKLVTSDESVSIEFNFA